MDLEIWRDAMEVDPVKYMYFDYALESQRDKKREKSPQERHEDLDISRGDARPLKMPI